MTNLVTTTGDKQALDATILNSSWLPGDYILQYRAAFLGESDAALNSAEIKSVKIKLIKECIYTTPVITSDSTYLDDFTYLDRN